MTADEKAFERGFLAGVRVSVDLLKIAAREVESMPASEIARLADALSRGPHDQTIQELLAIEKRVN